MDWLRWKNRSISLHHVHYICLCPRIHRDFSGLRITIAGSISNCVQQSPVLQCPGSSRRKRKCCREHSTELCMGPHRRRHHTRTKQRHYYQSITYQSFDWRTLVSMKTLDDKLITSALIDEDTAFTPRGSTSPWLAGLRLESFPGPSLSEQIAQAPHAIQADILSPTGTFLIFSSSHEGSSHFTTPEMISEAHRFGMKVVPWTVNGLDCAEELFKDGADGIITDYPNVVRRWAKQQGLRVAPKYPRQRVFSCLYQHMR
ncbi:uncharacterized protein F5891DRAFT_571268 [Suillus fuscotomentosus]|uniref:GP-PDE domain-containing protein n=1 Tax=Suillus fuscotomentosus TaxID=1912939 RepID=A0AAD4DMP0_9AGAM|nr:uncharacterized protein F5891DRAFT_571268 [Suillus fuscotomentosus]KAG1883520.1 hypothetical protein F5891DRAFT_571268 [Suillus fuscotomentosus]